MLLDADAQQEIDASIANFEGTIQVLKAKISELESSIRDLKVQRNTHSAVEKLPTELISKIFVEARQSYWDSLPYYKPAHGQRWWNVCGVCTHWRIIALNTPRYWGFVELTSSDVGRVTETLLRSGSLPLQVRCRMMGNDIIETDLWEAAEETFLQIGRAQELHLVAPESFIRHLSSILRDTSAPSLEVLHLDSHWFTLPKLAPQLSLRILELVDGTFRDVLPYLPSLRKLSILISTKYPPQDVPFDILIQSLRNTPLIEDITIAQLSEFETNFIVHTLPPAQLPHLSHLRIESDNFNASTIFNFIDHPVSTVVEYRCRQPISTGSDYSGIITLCSRFAAEDAPAIQQIFISGRREFELALFTESCPSSPHLRILLSQSLTEIYPLYTQLCSTLPLSTVPGLVLGGFSRSIGPRLLEPFRQVEVLKISDCTSELLEELLVGADELDPPLPNLRMVIVSECEFSNMDDSVGGEEVMMFEAMKKFLVQRYLWLGMAIQKLHIECCGISNASIAELEEIVEVEWDGLEASVYEYEYESMDDSGDSDEFSDLSSDDEVVDTQEL